MIRVGLISDTHSHLDNKVKEVFAEADEIWHAGDIGVISLADELAAFKPLVAVYGNIDDHIVRAQFPHHQLFDREGLRVLITHIGGYPGHYDRRALSLIRQYRPDVFVCGHSHILRVMRDSAHNNMVCLNPGAAGIHGFHHQKTVLRVTISAGKISQLEAVELGKRGRIE